MTRNRKYIYGRVKVYNYYPGAGLIMEILDQSEEEELDQDDSEEEWEWLGG